MNRRDVVLGAATLAGVSALGGYAVAQDGISRGARSLWRRALVLDCNLGPPVNSPTFPQPQDVLDTARSAGVSVIKTSIGGFNAPFEETLAELAFYQRLTEVHPDVFMQVRRVSDMETARRTRRLSGSSVIGRPPTT